jgi:hypothetical protein
MSRYSKFYKEHAIGWEPGDPVKDYNNMPRHEEQHRLEIEIELAWWARDVAHCEQAVAHWKKHNPILAEFMLDNLQNPFVGNVTVKLARKGYLSGGQKAALREVKQFEDECTFALT